MVYSKLTSLINTQKIKRKESKYTAIKNHQLTKKDSKRGKKDKGSTKKNQKARKKMVTVIPYLSIITLTINGLNSLIKSRVAEWIKEQDQTICCLQETPLSFKDTLRLK